MHTGSQLEAHTYIIILQRVNGVKRLKIRYAQWWCNTLRWVGDVLHSLVNASALQLIFALFVILECKRFLICTCFFPQICLHIGVLTPLKNCFSCPHPLSPKHRPCPHPIRALCPSTCSKHRPGILRAGSLPMVMSKAPSGHPKGILAVSHGHVQSTVRAS